MEVGAPLDHELLLLPEKVLFPQVRILLLDGAVDFVRMLLWVVRLLGLVDEVDFAWMIPRWVCFLYPALVGAVDLAWILPRRVRLLLLEDEVEFALFPRMVVRVLLLVDFVRRISMGAILWRGQRLDFEDVPEAFERDLQLEVGEDHVGVVLEVVERGHGLQFGVVVVGEVSAEDCSNCIFAG